MSLDFYLNAVRRITVFDANITHNLGKMAGEAGIYMILWRPEELGLTKADEIIRPLEDGLEKLKSDPDHYKQFNPENGWGDYDILVRSVETILNACKENPDAEIIVSR